jgi:MFS transporter, PPP family, 3-phenylpropionic acid transporter
MVGSDRDALWRFVTLYGALYISFGVQSPYLPSLLASRNLTPEAVAIVLAAGTAIRLAAAPMAGRLADRLGAPKASLMVFSAAAALIALGYQSARAFPLLFLICVLHSAALAPLAPLSDTLALGSAAPARSAKGFHYGWLRGTGSAAFICGTVLSGYAIAEFGVDIIIWLNAGLLAAAASIARFVPVLLPQLAARQSGANCAILGLGALLRTPLYRRIVVVAALILGSHAMHDSFAVIRWGAAGIGSDIVGELWSLQVVAEVAVFLFVGRPLLDRLGPAGAAMLAAAAGCVRWAVMAETAWLPAFAAVEPLHGLTFALLHLSCLRLLAESVPRQLAATALAVYGTVGIGISQTLLTLASGPLYSHFGARGFWVMAAISAAALPVARLLRDPVGAP